MKEIIETGRSVEDAINSACDKLGLPRDEVQFEIMDLPKKTFLGLRIIPAKVRVWVEVETDMEPSVPKEAKKSETKPAEKPKEVRKQTPPAPVKEKNEAKEASIVKEKEPAPKVEKQIVMQPLEMTPEVEAKVAVAKEYLESVCNAMGIQGEYTVKNEDGGICIVVSGQGLGAIIGRRGETLDALQYLVGLVANRLEGDYLRITVDCGDYRTKRKATLESLAKKLSSQVLKTNTSKTLEPMNPFERRIIHATVSEIEGVSSTSIGEEPNRRVVITSPTAKRSNYRDRGGNSRPRSTGGDKRPRSGGPRRDRVVRESTMGGTINTLPQNRNTQVQTTWAEPKKTPESSSDKPLYTKLDLE